MSSTIVKPNNEERQITSFNQFDLCPQILSAIASLGFKEPTLVQQRAIPLALQGRDVAAKARTGSGKTAAYLIPMLNHLIKHPSKTELNTLPRGLILVPTTELAEQVTNMVRGFSKYCKYLENVNLCGQLNTVQQLQSLSEGVEIVISTPARILRLLPSLPDNYLHMLKYLVVDEADLLLSFGYQQDLYKLIAKLPEVSLYQTFLASATLELKVADFASKLLTKPVYLDLTEAEGLQQQDLTQYVIQCHSGDSEKFLLIYFILKLNLIRGKILIFVNSINRAFRVRLFLEQFGIKSVVLNAELPLNSRLHIVSEFNKGTYDILIATDERGQTAMAQYQESDQLIGTDPQLVPKAESKKCIDNGEHSDSDYDDDMKGFESTDTDEGETESKIVKDIESVQKVKHPERSQGLKRKKHARTLHNEHGTSRGIDFHNVTAVINMDMPVAPQCYTHRAGRAARGGRKGMVLSFVLMDKTARVMDIKSQDLIDERAVYAKIEQHQKQMGNVIHPFVFNRAQVQAFQYRMEDALRSVTSAAIQSARVSELKREVLRSTRLTAHFEDHEKDLAFLRDRPLIPTRVQPHLKNLPAYLLPDGIKEVKVSHVQFNTHKKKMGVTLLNKRSKSRTSVKAHRKSRKMDPLKRLKL